MVRRAKEEDIPKILDMIYGFYDESLRDYGISVKKETLEDTLKKLIGLGSIFVDDELSGVVAGTISPSLFDKDELVGQELIWYVKPETRKGRVGLELINAFTEYCKSMGAKKLMMVHMENLNPILMNKLYTRKHYRLMEFHYIKEI